MELQLKHLAPYLIHNVKFYLPIESERFKSILENEPYSHIEFEWAIENDFNRAKEYLSMYFTQDSPFICYEDNELFLGQMKSNLGWEEDDVYLREMKLCLHPLSHLTKEIEINGEKFVPIEKLYPDRHILFNSKRAGKEILFLETKTEGGKSADYKLVIDNICRFRFSTYKGCYVGNFFLTNQYIINNYSLYEKLFEWHFDVFGLIEAGLAIDINTLNQK